MPLIINKLPPKPERIVTMGKADSYDPDKYYYPPGATEPVLKKQEPEKPAPVVDSEGSKPSPIVPSVPEHVPEIREPEPGAEGQSVTVTEPEADSEAPESLTTEPERPERKRSARRS